MGFVRKVVNTVGDVVDGAVHIVKDIGRSIDDMVHDVIPGGWGGVGALALLSVGIADPTLLGLAEEGTLTTEALTSAGVDAAKVAQAVSTVTPEVTAATAAATQVGITPEIIAAANATTDPIAALNALTGATTADTAYLAQIGATPAVIAAAEANNAAIAAKAAEGAAATAPATTTPATTTPATTTGPVNPSTQVFDDGSTLTTHPDGSVSATDTAGNATKTLVSPGGPGQAPVYDASGTAVPGTNNPLGNATDVPLTTGLTDYAKAVYNTLGPLGTAGLVAAATGNLGGSSGSATGQGGGTANYTWGEAQPLVNPGLNPGYIGYAASMPDYQTTSPTQAQYYWGVHAPVNTQADLANYNQLPEYAPQTPWGQAHSAVGGTAQMNVPEFVNQYITNPNWAGVMSGTSPGYTPSQAEQTLTGLQAGPAVPV